MGIPRRLKSRKFWITVVAFAGFMLNNQYTEAMGVVLAYLGMQGVEDTWGSTSEAYSSSPMTIEEEIDTTQVVTGNTPLFNEKLKDED